LVESSYKPTVILTDHVSALRIARQVSLVTTSVDKLNLRLVRASQYISQFRLKFSHKPGKEYIVPDALSRLPIARPPTFNKTYSNILDNLHAYHLTLVEISEEFKASIKQGYE